MDMCSTYICFKDKNQNIKNLKELTHEKLNPRLILHQRF